MSITATNVETFFLRDNELDMSGNVQKNYLVLTKTLEPLILLYISSANKTLPALKEKYLLAKSYREYNDLIEDICFFFSSQLNYVFIFLKFISLSFLNFSLAKIQAFPEIAT